MRMRIARWVPKATNKLSEYVLLFHCNNVCTNAPQCCVYTYIVSLVRIYFRRCKSGSNNISNQTSIVVNVFAEKFVTLQDAA